MASTADMNIILGQGDAIKEVHNPRKQGLELSQHVIVQEKEDKRKREKTRVRESGAENRIEIKGDEKRDNKRDHEDNKKGETKQRSGEASDFSGGTFIDIKV